MRVPGRSGGAKKKAVTLYLKMRYGFPRGGGGGGNRTPVPQQLTRSFYVHSLPIEVRFGGLR